MNKIWNYLNIKVPPIIEKSGILTGIFDAVYLYINDIYELFFSFISMKTPQSDSKHLEKYAKDRGIEKIHGETQVDYFHRIYNAYTFLKYSSTVKGMKHIIYSIFPEKKCFVTEYFDTWKLGENQLGIETILKSDVSYFYFVVEFIDPITISEKEYIQQIIDMYKPVYVSYQIKARINETWILGNSTEKLGINSYLN